MAWLADSTTAKVALLLRTVSDGLLRYGIKLMMLLKLAGTVIMRSRAEAELVVAGAEVIVAVPNEDELDGPITLKSRMTGYVMPVDCETAVTTTRSKVPARLDGARAVSVWSKLPDRVMNVALVDCTVS